jgi:hypothetical protein
MPRGGGQIIYVPRRTGANPLEAFGQSLQNFAEIQTRQQQADSYQQSVQAQMDQLEQQRLQQEAGQQQALAQLMALKQQTQPSTSFMPGASVGPAQGLSVQAPAQPSFSPQAQAAYSSVVGPLGADTTRKNIAERTRARLAQAPLALKTVQQEQQKSVALAEIDRLGKEASTSTDPLLADTKAARVSALNTARAAVQAGAPPEQIGQLVTQLGGTEGASIALALDRARLQTGKDTREEVKWATARLAQVAPEFASVAELPGGYSEAPKLLASYAELAKREASEQRLIGLREASDIRVNADREARTRTLQNEQAAAEQQGRAATAFANTMEAQLQLLSQSPQYQQNPEALVSEASNRAMAIVRRINPQAAAQFEQNGSAGRVADFMKGVAEIRGYTRSALVQVGRGVKTPASRPNNVPAEALAGLQIPGMPGVGAAVRGAIRANDALGLGPRTLEFLPDKLPEKTRNDIRNTAIKHMQWQYGVPEGTALAMWNQSGAAAYFDAYNTGIDELRKSPVTPPPGADPVQFFKQTVETTIQARLQDIGHQLAPSRVEARKPLTEVELENQFWRNFLGHVPGTPLSPGTVFQPAKR